MKFQILRSEVLPEIKIILTNMADFAINRSYSVTSYYRQRPHVSPYTLLL